MWLWAEQKGGIFTGFRDNPLSPKAFGWSGRHPDTGSGGGFLIPRSLEAVQIMSKIAIVVLLVPCILVAGTEDALLTNANFF